MEAVINKAKDLGSKAADMTIGVIAGTLDITSKGIAFLSSLVKGEKKINITVEEVKK